LAAEEFSMNITRRDFLQMLGVTGALAGGLSRGWAIPETWNDRLRSGPRIETWKVSTCGQCPAGCGIRVRLIDDIPVRILGNPIAPVNRGFVCPMGEAGLELLYHPDRIVSPMLRKGKKGESAWEPVSWDEAMNRVSKDLRRFLKEKRSGRVGFLMGDGNTLLTPLAGEFAARLGSSHFFPWRSPGVNELGLWQAVGAFPPFAFDLNRTDFLLTFGTNLLEEPPSPVHFNRLYGNLKEGRPRTGLRMVHVDARMSLAGKNATEWVQVRPGSKGVLALGMAHVLLRDKSYDREFIGRHAVDFRNGKDDFQELVLTEYSPQRVSEVTGVPSDTIIRLARGFGAAKAPLALSGGTSNATETALFTQWAVASLNALAGSFSAKGLWREQADAFSLMHRNAPGPEVPSSWVSEQLPHLAAAGKIPALETLFIAQANPVHEAADPKAWKEWLGRIPQVVQFATLLDDTSPYADLVLPVTTYLEHWDLTLPVPNLPLSQVGLQQPVVPPMNGARPLGDLLLQLAREAGAGLSPDPAVKSYDAYLQARMKPIHASGKGTPYFEAVSLEFLEELRKRGWQVYSDQEFSDFWRLLQEKGGWWDPAETPDVKWETGRKFLFPTASRLAVLLSERSLLVPGKEARKPDLAPHRRLEEPIRKPAAADTFVLVPFVTLMNMTGDGAGQPLLQELSGLSSRRYWQTWVEMHPDRARILSVREGDLVRVVSGEGEATLPVKIVPSVSPEILSVPTGQGHSELGRYARRIGANPIALLDFRVDPLSGRSSWRSTHVRVEKITK
jgi:anaerobic selenocysteine-containing dehydrogenase